MSQLEENARTKGGIMVVDDNPANLKLLEDMLRQKGYQVRSFSRGRLALTSAAKNPPDLILLDVSMPEMSGYEVCEQVRAIEDFPGIPVLFISAMDRTEDKISGFRAGGVDYIAKPFQFEEVHARVETHLKLRRAQKAEQQLLELTLNGAIRMLADMVQSNSPELAVRSRAIRDCVAWITHRMGVSEPWQYDLAATLCLIGCVTLPEEVFKRGYAGEINSAEDEAMFRNSFDLVAECGIAFLHVFPYSPRPGTPAARMPAVAPEIVRERAARLRAAGASALAAELRSRIGAVDDVLIERPGSGRAGFYAAVDCPAGEAGIQRLRFTGVAGDKLIGAPA